MDDEHYVLPVQDSGHIEENSDSLKNIIEENSGDGFVNDININEPTKAEDSEENEVVINLPDEYTAIKKIVVHKYKLKK